MLFEDVIGQHEIKDQLIQMVKQDRLSHSILILGKEGSGGLPLAMAFASYLICLPDQLTHLENNSSLFDEPIQTSVRGLPEPNDIAKTPVFQKAAQLIHPDIHYSFPVILDEKKKKRISNDYMPEWREFTRQMPYGNIYDWLQFISAENKQGNISAEECNDIIRKLSLKSFESPWKVLIMWMPEYLGKEGNKLLKLIEEPPPNTLFLLVAENEELILPTILSRCQIIRIPVIENADIEKTLYRKAGLDTVKARQIALVSEGNYRLATELMQHNEEDWQALLRQWLNASIKGTPKMQQDWINDIHNIGREKQKQFLKYFVHLLEQSMRLRIVGNNKMILPEKEMDFTQRLNKIAGIYQQEALTKELESAAYFIERNANSKILFHALTLKLRSIILDKKIIYNNNNY